MCQKPDLSWNSADILYGMRAPPSILSPLDTIQSNRHIDNTALRAKILSQNIIPGTQTCCSGIHYKYFRHLCQNEVAFVFSLLSQLDQEEVPPSLTILLSILKSPKPPVRLKFPTNNVQIMEPTFRRCIFSLSNLEFSKKPHVDIFCLTFLSTLTVHQKALAYYCFQAPT